MDIYDVTGTVVEGNLIGTDVAGTLALPNSVGVWVHGGSTQNTIGGSTSGAGNLISGNTGGGVSITDIGTARNVVAGNKIGTDVSGTLAVPNTGDGVLVNDSGSNTIGGSTSGAGNLVSGNSSLGVEIEGQSAYVNVVAGNLIGTDASGTAALGNDDGVGILGADYGNTIGGSAAGWGNLISGNTETGVVINGQDVVVQSVKNVIAGNLIGTDISGTFAVPNETGVLIDDSPENTIGGTVSGDANLISGNTGYGIYLDFGTTDTIIAGNKIGTDKAGTLALPNSTGIFVSANDNTIGGATAGMGNLISGNTADGVAISGSFRNFVAGNMIGTDGAGTIALANSIGVEVDSGGSGNTIGGVTGTYYPFTGGSNLISGNTTGISDSGGGGNLIEGNLIGTNATGTVALGNTGDGIDVSTSGDTIGGTSHGAIRGGNLISGNAGYGIRFTSAGATGNLVEGNLIGVDTTYSEPLGNGTGIELDTGAGGNTIGGLTAVSGVNLGNFISGNTTGISDSGGGDNVFLGNSIGTTGPELASGQTDGIDVSASGDTIGGTVGGSRNIISGNIRYGIYFTGALSDRKSCRRQLHRHGPAGHSGDRQRHGRRD